MRSAATEERLYGRKGDDSLVDDPADVVHSFLDDWDGEPWESFVIEEWSVIPTRSHMPTPHMVFDYIDEWTCENGEIGEGMEVPRTDDVMTAIESALSCIATAIGWRMADEKLRDLTVAPNPNDPDNPLVDGEPCWHEAKASE